MSSDPLPSNEGLASETKQGTFCSYILHVAYTPILIIIISACGTYTHRCVTHARILCIRPVMEYSRCACAGGLQYTDELMTDAEGFSVRVKIKVLRSV